MARVTDIDFAFEGLGTKPTNAAKYCVWGGAKALSGRHSVFQLNLSVGPQATGNEWIADASCRLGYACSAIHTWLLGASTSQFDRSTVLGLVI